VAIILPFFAQCQPAAPYVTEQFAVLDTSVRKKDLQQGKQLQPVSLFTEIQAGDIIIQGGFPGHAVIVMDVAADTAINKINPGGDLNPRYSANSHNSLIYSPEWTFSKKHFRRW